MKRSFSDWEKISSINFLPTIHTIILLQMYIHTWNISMHKLLTQGSHNPNWCWHGSLLEHWDTHKSWHYTSEIWPSLMRLATNEVHITWFVCMHAFICLYNFLVGWYTILHCKIQSVSTFNIHTNMHSTYSGNCSNLLLDYSSSQA